jgi:hypothetical protein
MPHLHLPSQHSPADLALAHRVAQEVESSEMYVTWSHASGPDQRPEVLAHVREEPSVLVETLATLFSWLGSVVEALITKPQTAQPQPEPPRALPARPRRAA